MAPNEAEMSCFIHQPLETEIHDLEKYSGITFLSDNNNNCAFKIKISDNSFGKWELLSIFKPYDGSQFYTKKLSLEIKSLYITAVHLCCR